MGSRGLWHSNAPWVGTGYGSQTSMFVPRLEAYGFDFAYSAYFGLYGSRLQWPHNGGETTVYPGSVDDEHANDVIGSHAKHWFGGDASKGLVVMLTDPWVMHPSIIKRLPVAAWIPVDHEPLIPGTVKWIEQSGAVPIAMARFGQEMMLAEGIDDPLYVPHGLDTKIHNTEGDRAELRATLGIPESAFVVGVVAANVGVPGRKGWPEMIRAFAEFKTRVPEAVLYLHTSLEGSSGENLPAICDSLGVKPISTDQYAYTTGIPAGVVAALMRSFDVLLGTSYGEGYGCPLMEAQGCGTPCIVTDFSSMPEVAPESAGNIAVDGQHRWNFQFDSWQVTPNIDAIVHALEQVHNDSEVEREARRAGVAAHASQFDADAVTRDYLAPALRNASERLSWRDRKMLST